ncbi:MAG TPA: Cof-type HAD-IIB family hydrolase [Candidatus Corynebacterium avicola]|uniref:Cof-type HAD-IIB family hydrolase n=1 Tax=Candidatus Corynebacterium avicola TaxID=2838527 RepID=A0A9D1RRK8_9CORY|nr:Cof-type HAD-IIB family hydrolase [Candidatus Corynebacterium avicola]
MSRSVLPRLIATDLDHTLLRGDRTVSTRTAKALDAARAAGIMVVPATARNPVGLAAVNDVSRFSDWALCGNGAYGIHLTTEEILFTVELKQRVLLEVTAMLSTEFPGVRFAAVRDAGRHFLAQEGYAELATLADHNRDPATMGALALASVCDSPALKLIARHPDIDAAELLSHARSLLGDVGTTESVEMTTSGAPFIEIMAPGVTKATGLERLCAHLGIIPAEVVTFGDGINDIEMLRWAGHGVAVANAAAEVREAADHVTAANDDDGVALVIEELLTAAPDSPR